MKQRLRPPDREAAGYFAAAVLAAISVLGILAIGTRWLVATISGEPATGLGRAVLVWVFLPQLGVAALNRLLRGEWTPGAPGRGRK